MQNDEATTSLRRSAVLWLMFLAPFFFISYGFANSLAASSKEVAHIVFAWERHIPFVPWTIIPYWSIDILYALSLFICTSRQELTAHVKRLLTAQVVAVICFMLFPLGFSFVRPETSGVIGWLYATLAGFDQPYNQAPSLHITLLVILWVLYPRHLPRWLVWPFHVLCVMIAVSVLTTYQHHFIDIPTGMLLGFLCVWLWPLDDTPVMAATLPGDQRRRRWWIATGYGMGSLALTALAFLVNGAALWLLWPAISLMLVAVNYAYLGSRGFQKGADGKMSLAATILYFPYLLGAKINSRLWTHNKPKTVSILGGVSLGRMPSRDDIVAGGFRSVVDMTAEFDRPNTAADWHAVPCLDLLVPSEDQLLRAARLIATAQEKGRVLVTCALGYSRSALAVSAWLLVSGRAATVDQAVAWVRQQRPTVVISDHGKSVLTALVQDLSR